VLLRSIAAGALCVAVTAPPASAGWLPPLPLSAPDQTSGSGAVALAPDGRMAAAWLQREGSYDRVLVAERAPGGALEAPQTVSPGGKDARGPQLKLDAQGNALLMWTRNGEVQWATRPAGSASFGNIDVLPTPVGEPAELARLAVAPNGAAAAIVVTQTAPSGCCYALRAYVRPPGGAFAAAGGTLDTSFSSPDASHSFGPVDLDADANGGFYATWDGESTSSTPSGETGTSYVVMARRPPGASNFAVQGVAGGDSGAGTIVKSRGGAVDGAGNVHVLYRLEDRAPTPDVTSLLLASRASGASFSDPGDPPETVVASKPDGPEAADIDMNAGGAGLIVWTLGGAAPGAEACFRPAGGPCGAVKTLQTGVAVWPAAAVGARGDAVAAWTQGLVPSTGHASFRPAGGAFEDPVDLGSAPNVQIPHDGTAVDALGHAVLVPTAVSTDPPSWVTAFVNDSVAPVISSLATPAGGAPGEALAFGGEVSDVWGPVSATWDFGDGSGASGPAATHSYAAPGVFTAALAATDAAGNSTTASGPVNIAAPDGTPPRILSFGATHTVFAVGRARTPLSASRVPVGTTFRFKASEPGSAAIGIQRKQGRRWKKLATLRRVARAGVNSVPFSGRLGRKALGPGAYRAVLTTTDAAKNKSKPRRLGFRVVRR
jgi:hypothetical protein